MWLGIDGICLKIKLNVTQRVESLDCVKFNKYQNFFKPKINANL